MSASASLRTGKNRRRALQALIAGPLLALGIAAGSGTAHASQPPFSPGEIHLADGYCAISGWPHGEVFCGTDWGVNFPNGTQEIFGIGKDDEVWTDWGTEASPSGWKSMGGPPNRCNPNYGLDVNNNGYPQNYSLSLQCWDINASGGVSGFLDFRGAGVSSGWSGWQSNGMG